MNIEVGSEWRVKCEPSETLKVLVSGQAVTYEFEDYSGEVVAETLLKEDFLKRFEPVSQAPVKQSEPLETDDKCVKCGGHVEFSRFLNTCQICIHQENLRKNREREGEIIKQKHSHYYKDVSRLSKIDIYSVCRLFNVTDPEITHAIKKLLCLGQRGHKDRDTDMQNVIDTLQRWQELEREFAND